MTYLLSSILVDYPSYISNLPIFPSGDIFGSGNVGLHQWCFIRAAGPKICFLLIGPCPLGPCNHEGEILGGGAIMGWDQSIDNKTIKECQGACI